MTTGFYFDVACDVQQRWVFYADTQANVIYRIRTNGTGTDWNSLSSYETRFMSARANSESSTVLVADNEGLAAMSYNWISHTIYYIDNVRNNIEVTSIEPPSVRQVLVTGLQNPTAIAVHPTKG